MKNFKKVVAAGLALLMLALSVNVTFAAESYTDKEAVVVAKVNAAGIMTGTDKGFEPSKTLTRAEAAAIFVRMKGISEATVKQNAGTTLFTDVAASHWAAGYVNVASNYGIIKGVGANKFAPEKEVTVAEFYTMAVRALNAGQLVESEGTWPTNYVNFAIENDLAEDVAQLYTAASTRMTAATIVANTLKAPMWEKAAYVNNGEITFTKGNATDTILKALNIKEYEKVKFSGIDSKKLTVNTDCVEIAGPLVDVDVNERAALGTAKEGIQYTVWYDTKEEEILGFWVPSTTDAIEFTNVKVSFAGGKAKLVVNGKEKEYDFVTPAVDDDTYFEINGQPQTASSKTDWTKLVKGDMPLFGTAYLDADGKKIEKVYAEKFDHMGIVKDATSARITFEKAADVKGSNAQTITINKDEEKDYQYFVTEDGKAIDVEDIAEGDVVFYYAKGTNNHTFVIDVYEETVEGKVSATNGSKVTIDGTKYDTVVAGIKAGDEGTFYFNNDGKIVMYELEEEAKGDYAVISQVRVRAKTYDTDKDLVEVKLATTDGKVSDWMSINVKKSDASWKTATQAKGYTNADAADGLYINKTDDTTGKKAVVAQAVVQYEIKDNKVVLKATDATSFSKFTDSKLDNVTYDTDKVAYLSSDAKAYEVFAYETGKYELKELNIDDIDTTKSAIVAYFADYDDDENEVGLLFFVSGVTNKTVPDWAIVLDASYDYDDGDDDTDEDAIYTVYFSNKETKTLYADNDDVVLAIGEVYELSLDGDVITRAYADRALGSEKFVIDNGTKGTLDAGDLKEKYTGKNSGLAEVSAIDGKFVHEVKGNGLVTFISTDASHKIETATAGYALSDDLMVIKVDDDELVVSDFDAINKLSETDNTVVLDEEDFDVITAVQYTEDDETEIIAIVYKQYKKTI